MLADSPSERADSQVTLLKLDENQDDPIDPRKTQKIRPPVLLPVGVWVGIRLKELVEDFTKTS